MSERVSRRQFFSLNLEATVGFLGNFLAPQFGLDREFFRPPGTDSELDFLTACTRCKLCKDSCPENIIEMFSLSSGAKLVNTPYIDPNKKSCTFCMECVNVCPTGALHSTAANQIGIAKFNQYSCLMLKDVLCDFCVYSCPEQAIKLVNGKLSINSEKCNGCGVCVSSCIQETKGIYISPSI
jgi:ferredoxin-type protein NapG